jgi:hypothetical protein
MMHHKIGGPIELICWMILGGFLGWYFGMLFLIGLGFVFGPWNWVTAFVLAWLVPALGAMTGITVPLVIYGLQRII